VRRAGDDYLEMTRETLIRPLLAAYAEHPNVLCRLAATDLAGNVERQQEIEPIYDKLLRDRLSTIIEGSAAGIRSLNFDDVRELRQETRAQVYQGFQVLARLAGH
jgi:hypothetical protein